MVKRMKTNLEGGQEEALYSPGIPTCQKAVGPLSEVSD